MDPLFNLISNAPPVVTGSWSTVSCRLDRLRKTCLNPNYCFSAGLPFLYWPQRLSEFVFLQDTHRLENQFSPAFHAFIWLFLQLVRCKREILWSCHFKLFFIIKTPAPVAPECSLCFTHYGLCLEAYLLQSLSKNSDFLPCLDFRGIMRIQSQLSQKPELKLIVNQTESLKCSQFVFCALAKIVWLYVTSTHIQGLNNAKLRMFTMKESCCASYDLLREHKHDSLADKEEHIATVFW